MMLLLAVLAASASVIAVNYYPILVKQTEITQAEKLKEDFLGIVHLLKGGEVLLHSKGGNFCSRGKQCNSHGERGGERCG